jgi:hypothetical protein
MSSQPGNINSKKDWLCPYLGFVDDRDTALSYPSQQNYCYHAKPICSVRLEQQRLCCLSGQFSTCPVFMNEKIVGLPKDLQGRNHGTSKPNSWMSIVALIVVFLLSILACNAFGIIRIPGFETLTFISAKTPEASISAVATEAVITPTEQTLVPSVTATVELIPTSTITPVPTEISIHQLETPFGETPRFVIHKVIGGESLTLLSEKYQTTKEAILAVNSNLDSGLWENAVIVIPVGISDTDGLPKFSVYQVDEDSLTIEGLAQKESADVNLLMQYNSLPAGYVFEKGEWVLISQ